MARGHEFAVSRAVTRRDSVTAITAANTYKRDTRVSQSFPKGYATMLEARLGEAAILKRLLDGQHELFSSINVANVFGQPSKNSSRTRILSAMRKALCVTSVIVAAVLRY